MIRLIGVLSAGGVPIDIKSDINTRGDVLLGALVEATKSLSLAMGSGEVKKLDFNEKKLIVTESKKGYTIVALVERAEDYIDTLVRIIASEIDASEIPVADGTVNEYHESIVRRILSIFVKHEMSVKITSIFDKVWKPIERQFQKFDLPTSTIPNDAQMDAFWNRLKAEVEHGIQNALIHARDGDFDRACAASIGSHSEIEKIFCIKMGALALSMTKAVAPNVDELDSLADTLSKDSPFSQFAVAIVKRIKGEIAGLDYSRALKRTIDSFHVNDEDRLLLSFLFMDTSIDSHPEFARMIAKYMQDEGFEIVANYIIAILDRSALFKKIYSITSYSDFRDELGVWKHQIKEVLEGLDKILKYRRLRKLLKRREANEKGQIGAMKLQNYITLLTAMAESPVLTIRELKEVLEEVLDLYNRYFQKLLETDVPLFAYTVDSVFQSLGVVNAEYFHLVTGEERHEHVKRMRDFLRGMLSVINEEGGKRHLSFAAFVVSNVLFPAFSMVNESYDEEFLLVQNVMRALDPMKEESQMVLRPLGYATTLGNMSSTLAALVPRILSGDERIRSMRVLLNALSEVHTFFLSHGMVCRDDLISFTFHIAQAVDDLSDNELRDFLRIALALNKIAVQDPIKYDYEIAMMGSPLIDLLLRSWRRLGVPKLLSQAINTLEIAISAWRKYGFEEKAKELEGILQITKAM